MNLIKKIILGTTIAFSASAFAENTPTYECNGDVQKFIGFPPNACSVNAVYNIALSLDYDVDNNAGFFYVWLHDINLTKNGSAKILRVYVDNNHLLFKEFQAVAQTAYVTRSGVSVIYGNPDSTPSRCSEYGNIINCPLISISLSH